MRSRWGVKPSRLSWQRIDTKAAAIALSSAAHLGHLHNAKELRRAQALLWLESGEEVEAVATRLHVSGRTLYRGVRRFEVCTPLSLGERLADGARSGRPRTAYGVIDPLIAAV